jgi:hypothetical protein
MKILNLSIRQWVPFNKTEVSFCVHPQRLDEEGVSIGFFADNLAGRGSAAVTGGELDAQQQGGCSGLGRLQGGRELE